MPQRRRSFSRAAVESSQNMQYPLLLLLLLMLAVSVMAQTRAAVANPMSQRGITFPKESFDDCFVDEERRVPGSCKLLEDCPAALTRWQVEHVSPKTCYFVKFDQYVCCDKTNSTTVPPRPIPLVVRPSVTACKTTQVLFLVGGVPTVYREFPFMAALGWPSNFDGSTYYRCGGTLISPTFVLTAAHCINFGGQQPSTERLGGDNLTLGMGEDHAIRRVITHPGYNDNTAYNDIALLELDGAQPSGLRIACLLTEAELSVTDLTAIGYGQISFAGLSSAQLLKVSLQHVSNEECQPHYPRDVLSDGLAATQMCAGDVTGKSDTCQGDSGGPLIMQKDSVRYVVGITSLGQGCASGPPSIYTRVSSYIDWIESIVWPKIEV